MKKIKFLNFLCLILLTLFTTNNLNAEIIILSSCDNKKENTLTKFIYQENNKILTDKIGYPQFYTQLLFEINNPNIMIKTVINNEEAVFSKSKCKKIERFEKES